MLDTATESLGPAATESYDLLRGECGLIPTEQLSVMTLTGDDRKGWLQGQATNDLRSFTPGTASAFCLCEATGQIQAICDIWAMGDKFVITTAKAAAGAVLNRVESMVVLEDVAAKDVTGEFKHFSVQGPTATTILSDRLQLPKLDAGEAEIDGVKVWLLRSNRTGLGGWDLLVPTSAGSLATKLTKGIAKIHASATEAARLEAGIPVFGLDVTAKTMPPELGLAFEARHVSYNKGCYMGQEVLMRIHSRGHTNRSWVGLVAEQPLESEATISHSRRPDAGVVTSAAFSPDYGYIAGAMLRSEAVAEGETVVVHTKRGDVEAEVRIMPILRFD